EMDLREALLEAAQHLAKPVERQLRMQAADDMELRDRLAPALACPMPNLFERHSIGLRIAHPFAERAQSATGHTDVGRIDVAVDVEISGIAVQALAHDIREIAERQNVVGPEEGDTVVKRESLALLDLFADRKQTRIVNNDRHVHRP